jgi:hypothetical protein
MRKEIEGERISIFFEAPALPAGCGGFPRTQSCRYHPGSSAAGGRKPLTLTVSERQDPRRDAPLARPERPAQDLIRRIADAMRISGKNDWLQLAVIAVEALTVEDLRDLMPTKVRGAPAAAIELHA